jgi:hypothetical protein
MIDVGHFGPGGTISSAGQGSVITGSAVRISQLMGTGVPQQDGALFAVGGTAGGYGAMNFVTGIVKSVRNLGFGIWEYAYDGGGLFTVRGNVAAAGITGNQVLLSGTFYDGKLLVKDTGAGYVVMMQAAGNDTKNASLLNFFGLPNNEFAFSGFSIAATVIGSLGSTGAFSAIAHSSGITNAMVPEPATMMLIGSGIIFLSTCMRRRTRRNAARLS